MPTWLDIIMGELGKIESKIIYEPTEKIRPRDHVVGNANDELKKLYRLTMQYKSSGFESSVAMNNSQTQENFDYHLKKTVELNKKCEILEDLFWVSVRDSLNLWDKPLVGIRESWKVVWSEEPEPESESEQHKIVVMPAMSMN